MSSPETSRRLSAQLIDPRLHRSSNELRIPNDEFNSPDNVQRQLRSPSPTTVTLSDTDSDEEFEQGVFKQTLALHVATIQKRNREVKLKFYKIKLKKINYFTIANK